MHRYIEFARAINSSRSFRRNSCTLLIVLSIGLGCPFAWPSRRLAHASGKVPFSGQVTTSAQSGTVIRSEVEVQTLSVQVKNKKGDDVKGLSADDFTVREDGAPQKITFFDAGSGPVDVVVLVDSSGSMVRQWHLGSAQEIATRFMRVARPADHIWAMDFTEWLGPFVQITATQLSKPGALSIPSAGSSGSSVYDAIASAVCHLRDSQNTRQAVIVITDGADEHSRISLDRLIDLLRSQRAQLFLIGLPSRPGFDFRKHAGPTVTLVSGHDINSPSLVFDRLAKEAAAQTFTPSSDQGIQDALNAVSNLLEMEYTLAYYPPPTSRKLRKIEIKVNRPGARVVTNRLVVAKADSSQIVHFLDGTCTVSPDAHRYPYESRVTVGAAGTTYRDDFSDSSSGWPQHPDSHYVSGGYELATFTPASADATTAPAMAAQRDISTARLTTGNTVTYREHVVAAYGPSWNDFRMSATMKVLLGPAKDDFERKYSTPVHPSAGLVFRMNQTGYYALLLGGPPNDKYFSFELVARRFEGDSFADTVITPWTPIPAATRFEMSLAVEDVGDEITVFVNGQQVGTARDGTFSAGYAGFVVSAPARATFCNLVVEQASMSQLATSVALAQVERTPSDVSEAVTSGATPAIESNEIVAPNKPWMSKPYDAWNDKDIQSVITRSPWVQATTIRRTWLQVSEKDAPPVLISGGIRSWPADAPNLQGSSPAVTIRESEESKRGELNVYVYWDSSRVMRAAFARQSALRGEIDESDVEPYVHAQVDEYALALTMADMTPFQQKDEKFFQRQAFLEMKSRGRELAPSHVVYQSDAKGKLKQVVFFFPKKTSSGEPTITPDETEVEFKCQIGDSTVVVGFNPQKMRDQAGPDL